MNSQRKEKADTPKREYAKPQVRTIELSAEETLAVGCKMADGGNAAGGFTCISNACAEAGS